MAKVAYRWKGYGIGFEVTPQMIDWSAERARKPQVDDDVVVAMVFCLIGMAAGVGGTTAWFLL